MRRHEFTDPITRKRCALVIPAGGHLFDEPKIGIAHPDCDVLADLSVVLDAFYCQACLWNGRVSGAWCADAIEASRSDEVNEVQ